MSYDWGTSGSAGHWGFPPPFGRGPRDEVKILLDDRDALFDGWAWALHQMHQARRPPCDCSGGCARCCWTPATMWFDVHRAALAYWQDVYAFLYRRPGERPAGWPWPWWGGGPGAGGPARDGEKPERLIVSAEKGKQATASFTVFNPTCDAVELEIRVDGFKDKTGNGPTVKAAPEGDRRIVGAGERRKVVVTVDATKLTAAGTFEGCVLIKTPFTKRLDVEIQVTA